MSGRTQHRARAALSRRGLLGMGVAAGLGLTGVAGCTAGRPSLPDLPELNRDQPTCVSRSSLARYDRLAGLPLVYEDTRRRSSFAVHEGFAGQLDAWLTDLAALTGWAPRQLWTYGTWTDGGTTCSSWHNAGRAFDLARLRLADGSEATCRYDLWRDLSGPGLITTRRTYWAVAASAHKHFAYVLTYLYNAQHHNHIHLDNGRSGAGLSMFSSRSAAQVQAIQGICTHLWDATVEITGRWDAATRSATRTVLADLGLGKDLADQQTWSGFLDASTRRGVAPA